MKKSVGSTIKNSARLFVYGTLLNPMVQKQVLGKSRNGVADVLFGYGKTKMKIEHKVYPAIVRDTDGMVKGKVIHVAPEDLELLDSYETKAYARVIVTLQSGQSAWCYIKS